MDIIDIRFMKLALKLAAKGRLNTFPNPMVGCLIVKNGKAAGFGFHEYFGGPHAEINALKMAGKRSSGATMYVTLEPCNHWGKTPPCTNAIINSGIKRVVVASKDPNPLVSGKGIEGLISKGIEVNYGVLANLERALNTRYRKHIIGRHKPHCIAKAAMTFDGKISTETGDSKWISSDISRRFVHKLRSEADAVIVGIGTVIKDNPLLTSHGAGNNPVRVIIDPKLNVPLSSNVLNTKQAATIVVHSVTENSNKLELLSKKGVILIRVPKIKDSINFKHIINILCKMHIYKTLIEGGGETISSAVESASINEFYMFISPKIAGGRHAKTPVEGTGIKRITDAVPIKSWKMSKIGRDFLIKARIR